MLTPLVPCSEQVPTAAPALRFNELALASRFLLAPLAGYTNLAFRLSVRELGGLGSATSDLVNARALLLTSRKTMDLVRTCPEDRPVAMQIYGTDPKEMHDAAQWLEAYGVSAVDINMGCPVHKVVRGGGGSAMMCDSSGRTIELVRTVVESVRIPVTVKMRLGWDDASWSAPFFARAFEEIGVAAVTIHGRTREQGFHGKVNLEGIASVVAAVKTMPIIGNGDLRTVADVSHMLNFTGCAGVAIGRGALLNPWFFCQLARWERTGDPGPGPTYEQRLSFMERHHHRQVKHQGEHFACLTFRKVANWYCKTLRPGRVLQQRLMMLDSAAEFERCVQEMRERGAPEDYGRAIVVQESPIRVPKGPIAHW